jgi:hypothetical protein
VSADRMVVAPSGEWLLVMDSGGGAVRVDLAPTPP